MKNKLRKWFEKYRTFQVFNIVVYWSGYLQIYTNMRGIEKHRWWTIIPSVTVGYKNDIRELNISLSFLCYLVLIKIQKQDGTFVSVIAEIADTEESRTYGFMNRKKIPDGTGMLFVFDYDQILSFWMKNTPSPLSFAYIDRTGKIADIYDMTTFSLASITSSRSVRYALEVPQSWYEKNGIKKGDVLKLKK